VILTVPSLEGETIEDYSIKVAEAWKIGQKGKDNGIIFTVAKQERKMRIEVGRGLEGKLTDLMAGRIIDLVITPLFKQGNYDEGFKAGVAALIDATRGEFKAEERPASRGLGYSVRSPWDLDPMLFLMIIFLVVFFGTISISAALRKRGGRFSGWNSSGSGWSSRDYSSGGGWDSGGGSDSSSDSGGGVSGGGGSFGGGGASGSW